MSRHLLSECLKLEKMHAVIAFWKSPEVDHWRAARFTHLSWAQVNVALLRLTDPSAGGELHLSREPRSQTQDALLGLAS